MLQDVVRRHLAALHDDVVHQAAANVLLSATSPESWPDLIAREPALRTPAGLNLALDGATRELYRDAGIGMGVIDAVLAVPLTDPVLCGRALRLRAHGLHRMAEGERARATLAEAITVLSADPAGVTELLHARLFAAYLENETGESDVLLTVRVIASTFAAYGDASGALQARLMEAAILFERDAFSRALAVNKDALRIAETLMDERQKAIGLGNIGQCLQELSQVAHERGLRLRARAYADEAISYFARAEPIYESLGMHAEIQKFAWGLACIAKQGDLEEARTGLTQVRERFLKYGMLLDAALVGLDLVEVLVKRKRHDLVESSIEEVLTGFARTQMPRYAVDAFRRVQANAAQRQVDAFLLARVRAEMQESFEQAA